MEQARRVRHEDEFEPQPERAKAREAEAASPEGLEKVLRFALPGKQDGESAGRTGPVTAREFAAAVDIVHEAAEAMRAAEGRSRDADARTQALAQRATEELKNSELRVQAAEGRARAAEARAQEAEQRAKDAEAWLRQIFSTIAEELPVKRPA
jgi:hypothetical protein